MTIPILSSLLMSLESKSLTGETSPLHGQYSPCLPTRLPGSIPGGSEILISNLELGVPFVCVLSSVVSGGGPDIVLTTQSRTPALSYMSSVLVHNLLFPLQASDLAFEL